MVAAGEDPKFIARRLIISASEDVGNADPRALQIAMAAAQAVDWVGLPECQYALAQATVYIATAPKSNRSGQAYWKAMEDVRQHGSQPVPKHLQNAPHRRMKSHGIGVGYKNAHDYEDGDVEQQGSTRCAGRKDVLRTNGPWMGGARQGAYGFAAGAAG